MTYKLSFPTVTGRGHAQHTGIYKQINMSHTILHITSDRSAYHWWYPNLEP